MTAFRTCWLCKAMRTTHYLTLFVILSSITRSCYGNIGENCTATACTGTGEVCNVSSCVCDTTNHYPDNGGLTCLQKVGLGSTCIMKSACSNTYSDCLGQQSGPGSTCQCTSDYFDSNTVGFDGGSCFQKIALNDSCNQAYRNLDQCADDNAVCIQATGYTCKCKTGYHVKPNDVTKCEANKPLGGDCVNKIDCTNSNAECLGSKCTCGTQYYDSNGNQMDGICRPVSELRVTNINFQGITTSQFSVSWDIPEGKAQYIQMFVVDWADNSNGGGSITITGTQTTLLLNSGIIAGKTYNVKITSINNQLGVDRSAFTSANQDAKPNPPTWDAATDINPAIDNTITVSWNAQSGSVYGYQVSLIDGSTTVVTAVVLESTFTRLTSTNIKNGYTYTVQIISKSESNTVESDPLTYVIKTEVIAPGAPTGANCKEVADEFITVDWNAPAVPNGDLRQYFVHVYNSTGLVKIVGTDTVVNELKVLSLKPGTYYNFRVYTENEKYNSSLYGEASSCQTKPKMSDAPQDLAITGVTSRAFIVSWRRPSNTYSEEILGYVLQIKEGDSCVQEIKYKCSNCQESFDSAPTSSRACNGGDMMDESKSNAELQNSTLMFSNNTFKPDTDYTILVAAVNGIGWGHQAVQSVRSKEEEPQEPPKAVIVSDIGKTSFNVSWSLIGPRPGQVTYTVKLTADTGAEDKTYTVEGYKLHITLIADGLEEYWNYTVKVTARTNVGDAKTSDTTQKYRTLPSAPGAVTKFEAVKAKQRSDNFHKITIRWKAPSLLERNSNIKEYVLKHIVGNITTNSGVAEQLQTLSFVSNTGDEFYSKEFDVIPESTYQFEVYAVNIESTDNIGKKMTINEMAPPGFPVSIEESDTTLQVLKESSKDQTFISLNLVREFFTEETNGRVQRTALLGCKNSACPENILDYADTQEKIDALANWQKAAQNGLYRITSADWLTKNKRRRRSSYTEVQYTVGIEKCDGVTEGTYCNGPLEPKTEYIFVAVVCTSTGCTVSKKYGPFITKEAAPQPVGMILGIIVGVIAILAIAVVVVFILRRRRNKTPPINEEHSVGIENNTDSVSTKDGIRLIVYENVISGNQGELKTAGQNYNIVNISGCWSEKDYKLCFAPTIDNVNQFWTMIYDEEVNTIVMFAESKAQKKESRYWPSDFNERTNYGHVDLETTYLNTHDAYTHMKMNICNRITTRTVNHFQCAPVSTFSPYGFVDFVKFVRSNVKTGRIVLHSSEGLGSAVPFVVLDTCIQQLSGGPLAEKVDVYKMLVNMVKTRKDLMPPLELFIFTHDCVQILGSGDYEPLQNTAQIESVYQTLQVDE